MAEFLKEYGWKVIEDIGYDEMAEKYVKPTGRILASTPVVRMVYAEKVYIYQTIDKLPSRYGKAVVLT